MGEDTACAEFRQARFSPTLTLALSLALCLIPEFCFADLQGSLDNIKFQLTHLILPTLSVIGMGIAAISFFTGNPQAKQHMVYAILGCCFGFGAEAIMELIRSIVN
jgi:hypothetical protein